MMKKLLGFTLTMSFAFLVPSVSFGGQGEKAGETTALAHSAKAVLQSYCAGCHGGGKAVKGGFGFVLDRDLLVSRQLVTPGRASQSDLFTRMQQGDMPPPSAKNRPTAAEIKIIERWIDAGAPPFDGTASAAKIRTPGEISEAIITDLERLDPRRRRFTRYLTLGHLALAGRSIKELETTREAANKLVNSLSWHPRITLLDAVDADGMILRIDLRSYRWSATQWEKLVAAYPYKLQMTAESKAMAGLSGTEFPGLRADWFVATASRPPFYHDLLQLPTSDKALERLLQVDVSADIQEDNIRRAGFNDSGVSKNNRLLQRHDAAYGAFWRSYDFATNTGRQNLFEHPIGPNTGAISFQPAGGEMIFHLPNGLQAYMLVNGKGQRIDKGPIEIVADPRRPDQKVETGISCMSCHARGLLFKADQLRGHVEKNAQVFGKPVVDAVRATHPRPAKFKAQIDEDNVRYHKALREIGRPELRKESVETIRDPEQEPVNLVTLRFEGTLDGRTAAAELGLSPDEFTSFLKQNPDHARIFGSLLVKGGTAQRTTFQENFPELSRRLIALQASVTAKAKPTREPPFSGHTGTINAIAFSNDGLHAATGSDDRTIRIWEIPSGRLLAKLEGTAEVFAVAFSVDGKFLLSGGRDRLLHLWDLDQRRSTRTFKGHTDSIRAVAFSPDGKRAASGGDDRSIRIWDLATGEEKVALTGHTEAITSIVWYRDNQQLVSSSRDGTIRWWDSAREKQLARLDGHAGPVLCVAMSHDGRSLLSGGNDKTIRQWSLPDAKELRAFKGHDSAVVAVRFHVNGFEFFSAASQNRTRDECFRRWDLADRVQTAGMKANAEDSFGCAAISPDGRHVLVGGAGGFLRLVSW